LPERSSEAHVANSQRTVSESRRFSVASNGAKAMAMQTQIVQQ
jgi:hypothetical protein